MSLPYPLSRVRDLGLRVFPTPFSANLVVVRGPGNPGDWDGVLYLCRRETHEGGWLIEAWPAATRPGLRYLQRPINPAGTGMLAAGVQNRLSHKRGNHHGDPKRPALVQVGEVAVLRDPNRDDIHEPIVPEDNTGGGFNVHDITHPGQLAGCVGLWGPHMTALLSSFAAMERHQGEGVSLAVIEG